MAKAGRRRKTIRRQPNGQPYRPPVDLREVVVNTRCRLYRLSKDDAKDEWAGFEIGRMALRGAFGSDKDEQRWCVYTVDQYVMLAAEYMRYKCPSHPMPKAMDYLAGRGLSLAQEPSPRYLSGLVDRYEAALAKLAIVPAEMRITFHEVAFHDKDMGSSAIPAVVRCVQALRAR